MHTFVRACLGCCLLAIGSLQLPAAQDPPEEVPAGHVVGKVWHTRVKFEDSFQYLQKVREELEIPQSPVLMIMQPSGVNLGPGRFRRGGDAEATEVEMKGTLFFLQTKPTVSLSDQISFELIGSESDFTDYVKTQHSMMGPAAELLGDGDRYELKLNLEKLMAQGRDALKAPQDGGEEGNGSEEPKPRGRVMMTITTEVRSGSGKPGEMQQLPKSMSMYYRYVDGIVYSARTPALHTIELPTRSSLKLSDDEAANDLYADFDLREIPTDLKRVFWSAVESQAAVFLQRFDQEGDGDYSLRRAIAEGRLELVKSVLFDVDRASLALNLSPDDVQPITARLKVQARENSPLAAVLESLGCARSQLGILQDEQFPLVISGTMSIPESLRPFSVAFVSSLSLKLQDLLSATPGSEILVEDLMEPLQQSAAAGVIDAAVSLRGSVSTGLIPCGGIKLENAEQFVASLESVLQITGADNNLLVTHDQIGDYRMVSIRRENSVIPAAEKPMPVQLNLAATGSWLWLTVGGEPAVGALEELVSLHDQSDQRSGESVPLLVRFRLNQWFGETDDALSQLPARMMTQLERWIGRRTAPKMTININGQQSRESSDPNEAEFTSYAAKAFRPENSQLEIQVRTASREFLVDATVGTAIVKFAVAQFLDAQSRMFKGMDLQFQPSGEGGGPEGGKPRSVGIGIRVGSP